ncbi:cytochrome b5 [Aureobasidium pullulans]|uniref:Cytochrome b5 n=1 Tax=Aureobasidium pullulans TaxID=5580 RepID=A0AB74JTC9_AURPU|nr:cytochrome b5 [Aureobasidium pullulans]THX65074.1 cytochrome b5 [Aureobasidium pullulans]
MSQEFTYSDISEHNTKKDLFMVVHDKVYNCTSFVDEHPGGEEVMLDVGGQDATEAFEDVGHSDEAREILEGLLVGTVKRQPGDPAPKSSAQPTSTKTSGPDAAGLGAGLYAILLVGGALAYFVYSYLQANGADKQ